MNGSRLLVFAWECEYSARRKNAGLGPWLRQLAEMTIAYCLTAELAIAKSAAAENCRTYAETGMAAPSEQFAAGYDQAIETLKQALRQAEIDALRDLPLREESQK